MTTTAMRQLVWLTNMLLFVYRTYIIAHADID